MDKTGISFDAEDGGFVLDAAFLAGRFAISEAEIRALMTRRLVQSRVERGEGEDAGRWRLSVRIGNRVWRGVFLADGSLQSDDIGLAPPRRPLTAPASTRRP